MIDGTYEFLTSTPIGEKRGTAVLRTDGDQLTAEVKIAGFPRQTGTGTFAGDAFSASGSLKIPLLGAFEYRIEGTVVDDFLEATCETNRGNLRISGVRTGDAGRG